MAYNRARQTNAMRKALNKPVETVKPTPVTAKTEPSFKTNPPLNSGNFVMVDGMKIPKLDIPNVPAPKTEKKIVEEHYARVGITAKKVPPTRRFTNKFINNGKTQIVDRESIGPLSTYELYDRSGKQITRTVKWKGKKIELPVIHFQGNGLSRAHKRGNANKKNEINNTNYGEKALKAAAHQAFQEKVISTVQKFGQEKWINAHEAVGADVSDARAMSFHYGETHPNNNEGIGTIGEFHIVDGKSTFFKHKKGNHDTSYYRRQAREFNNPVGAMHTKIAHAAGMKTATEQVENTMVIPTSKGHLINITPVSAPSLASIAGQTENKVSTEHAVSAGVKKLTSIVNAKERVVREHNTMATAAHKFETAYENVNSDYFTDEALRRKYHLSLSEAKENTAKALMKHGKKGLKIDPATVSDEQMLQYLTAREGNKEIFNSSYTDSDYQLVADLASAEREHKLIKRNLKTNKMEIVGDIKPITIKKTWENQVNQMVSSNSAPTYSILENKNHLQTFMMMNNRKGAARSVNKQLGKKPTHIVQPTLTKITKEQQLAGEITPQNPTSISTGSVHSPITGKNHIDKKLQVAITTGSFKTADFNVEVKPNTSRPKGAVVKKTKKSSVRTANSFTTVFASDIANNARGTAGAAARVQIKTGTTKKGKK